MIRSAKKTGRSWCARPCEDHHLVGFSTNSLIRFLNLFVSKSTVVWALDSSEILPNKKRVRSPKPSKDDKKVRKEFAREILEVQPVRRPFVITDERRLNWDGSDCWHNYWHDLRKELGSLFSCAKGGRSVMVWTGVSITGKTKIAEIARKTELGEIHRNSERLHAPATGSKSRRNFWFSSKM